MQTELQDNTFCTFSKHIKGLSIGSVFAGHALINGYLETTHNKTACQQMVRTIYW